MPESPAVTPKIANTRAVPAIAVASGRAMTRCSLDSCRTRSSEGPDIRSAILPGELLDPADVVLGHEAGARADVPGAVHRGEAVGVEPRPGLGAGLERGHDLGEILGVLLLHDRQDGHRDVALEVRLLVDRERHGAVLDAGR